ncbi:MAG: fibrobacter succinogenes major paralogous domain-containing protein [Saprospiraceae bacterium]|nr:fibrobacter succinogenes major paralogous domain-containing protein [Saprospiraceae bacterium]
MGENLRTTKYALGADIPQITAANEWSMLTFGAWCWYENMSSYEVPYGKLYNWFALEGDSLCPLGWHVPDDSVWNTLIDYLDPGTIDPEINGPQSYVAGGKLKEVGFDHWPSPNEGANNDSGFTALSGGNRFADGVFHDGMLYGFYWRASEFGSQSAVFNALGYIYPEINRNYFDKKAGVSVRCIKD